MDYKKNIQDILIHQLFASSNLAQITSLVLAAILVYTQHDDIDFSVSSIWFAVIVLVALLRVALVVFYKRARTAGEYSPHIWLAKFRLGVLASGLVWGAAGVLLFPAHLPDHQMFVIFMLAGLTAGAVISYSADLLSASVFTIAVLLPVTIRIAVAAENISTAMTMALLLYLGFMVISLRQMNRNIRENIVLRIEAAVREKAVSTSEERYRLLLQHSPVGILHFDTNLVITYCNDRFAEILHTSSERLLGLDMKALKYQAILPAMRIALQGDIGCYEGQYIATFSDANGWISMTCASSQDGDGKIVGGIAIIQDITERNQAEIALHESHQEMYSLLNSMAEGAYGADINGNCSFVNRAFLRILGYEHESEIIGKSIHDLIHYARPDGSPYPVTECKMYNAYRNKQEIHVADEVFWRKDGTSIPVEYWSQPIVLNGAVQGAIATFVDITERKQAIADLRESEERFRQMFERHSAVMLLVEPRSGMIVDANPAAANFYGYPLENLRGKDIRRINLQSETEVVLEMQQAIKEERNFFVFDHRLANGEIRTVEVHSSPLNFRGNPILFSIIHDITERRLAEAQIHSLAFYDALTLLPNRRLLNDRLDQAIAASNRSGLYGALMFLDLDNFKPLNDTLGHKVGDLLLIEVARRLSRCIRETDTAARFGGDEFVVMLNELNTDETESSAQARIVAEKIRAELSVPYVLKIPNAGSAEHSIEHHCTSSIGVVIFNCHANQEEILKSADMAMYQAKRQGRNCVVVNQPSSGNVETQNSNGNLLRLNWHESYNCGELTIDQEHRQLFELANTLIESAFTRKENPQKFEAALEILIAHIAQHFADEESILARHSYIDLEAHLHAHRMLLDHARHLRAQAAAGEITIGELVNFLADEVVAQHLLKTDRQFYPLFAFIPPTKVGMLMPQPLTPAGSQ
jgi:diguanylate cyclase (GGDEF)-like protein/hemerythrin-like metal-binding protein/PAS domain S-box-containing protein